jgi:hypothetical protein
MNKLVLISSVLFAFTAGAQYVPLKDFQDNSITSGGWTTQVVTSSPGSYTWTTSNQGTGTNYYAKASGWNGTSADNSELWLISPSFSLASATNPVLNFDNAKNFTGLPLEVKVSTNYSGTGNPSAATWTDISTQVTWSPGTFTFVNSGEVDLSAFMPSTSVYVAFVYKSNPTDGASTWEIDDVEVREFVAPVTTTIAEVQATTSGDQSDLLGSTVTVGGRVSAFKTGSGFWIQDAAAAWSGIYVYDFGDNIVAIGDSVVVTGTVVEFAPGGSTEKATQIGTLTSFQNVGSYTPYPALNLSTTAVNAEMYEGVLVKVSDASCSAVPDAFNEWVVNDGSGVVRVDDFMYAATPVPMIGNVYNVTGVVSHSFAAYKILPRDANDVQLVSGASIEEQINAKVSVYPNPSDEIINVLNANGETIRIFNTLGQLIVSTKNPQISLKNGVYFVRVGESTTRVIIR